MTRKSSKKSPRRMRTPSYSREDLDAAMREFFRSLDRKQIEQATRQQAARRIVASEGSLAHWDTDAPRGGRFRVEPTAHFNARGMRRIYGRGDGFGRRTFNMDVWTTRDGRVLARFWSRCDDVGPLSYEVSGLKPVPPRQDDVLPRFSERNAPAALRREYDSWILTNF